MDSIDRVKKEIKKVIKGSPVPEDPIHSENTLEWLLHVEPNADESLRIAALGHDIERAIEELKIRRNKYKDYDEFKEAHASNSARILVELVKQCGLNKKLADDIFFLVRHHETGGTKRANILKDADTISFFQVNLPFYFDRNCVEETRKRCLWGYKKLPNALKKVVIKFDYQNKKLKPLLHTWIGESEQS